MNRLGLQYFRVIFRFKLMMAKVNDPDPFGLGYGNSDS